MIVFWFGFRCWVDRRSWSTLDKCPTTCPGCQGWRCCASPFPSIAPPSHTTSKACFSLILPQLYLLIPTRIGCLLPSKNAASGPKRIPIFVSGACLPLKAVSLHRSPTLALASPGRLDSGLLSPSVIYWPFLGFSKHLQPPPEKSVPGSRVGAKMN